MNIFTLFFQFGWFLWPPTHFPVSGPRHPATMFSTFPPGGVSGRQQARRGENDNSISHQWALRQTADSHTDIGLTPHTRVHPPPHKNKSYNTNSSENTMWTRWTTLRSLHKIFMDVTWLLIWQKQQLTMDNKSLFVVPWNTQPTDHRWVVVKHASSNIHFQRLEGKKWVCILGTEKFD